MPAQRSLLDIFGVSIDLLTEVVLANPSLRGYILGYLAERMLRDWFVQDGRITRIKKDDDHDRENKDCHVGIGAADQDGASTGRWTSGVLRSQGMP